MPSIVRAAIACVSMATIALFVPVPGGAHSLSVTAVQSEEARHIPPVDAPIIDPFRPPDKPWLAGNRGIEYDTAPGQVVSSSADGVVTFAGVVASDKFVTIRHSLQLVTTVGFVQEILVEVGQRVAQGDQIALAGETMHFTARLNGEYIDPESLFSQPSYAVHLIPVR